MTPIPAPQLEDEAIRLRPWREDDLWARVDAWRDAEANRFMLQPAPRRPSLDAARAWLADRERRREDGEALFLVVADRATDRALGWTWLHQLDRAHRLGELGYLVLRDARGRGIATRAATLLAGWALEALELERLVLYTFPENAASQRVAEKAGFHRAGTQSQRLGLRRVELVRFVRAR